MHAIGETLTRCRDAAEDVARSEAGGGEVLLIGTPGRPGTVSERKALDLCADCSDPAEDVARFKAGGGQVLIGTPGRLADLMRRCPSLDARRLEVSCLCTWC